VAYLTPFMEAEKAGSGPKAAGKVLLATVKGDVHDIGKNIVGVVLQCNNYEVIDLGVMVPADRILDAAIEHGADIVGLSGLITPSLDEMVFVAAEMERRGFDKPLLIGGATTSRTHTAVKIEPSYRRGPTIYVTDASRAVGVVSGLLSETERDRNIEETRSEYVRIRETFARGPVRPRATLVEARANRFPIDWSGFQGARPSFLGVRSFPARDLGRAGGAHRLDALLRQLGSRRPLPRHSGGRCGGRGRAWPVCRRPADAGAHRRGALVRSAGRGGLLARQRRRRRHRPLR
jgi:5-methyltetrahydrofolate--homocysteine methyltransferase